MPENISRRDFLKRAGNAALATGGFALGFGAGKLGKDGKRGAPIDVAATPPPTPVEAMAPAGKTPEKKERDDSAAKLEVRDLNLTGRETLLPGISIDLDKLGLLGSPNPVLEIEIKGAYFRASGPDLAMLKTGHSAKANKDLPPNTVFIPIVDNQMVLKELNHFLVPALTPYYGPSFVEGDLLRVIGITGDETLAITNDGRLEIKIGTGSRQKEAQVKGLAEFVHENQPQEKNPLQKEFVIGPEMLDWQEERAEVGEFSIASRGKGFAELDPTSVQEATFWLRGGPKEPPEGQIGKGANVSAQIYGLEAHYGALKYVHLGVDLAANPSKQNPEEPFFVPEEVTLEIGGEKIIFTGEEFSHWRKQGLDQFLLPISDPRLEAHPTKPKNLIDVRGGILEALDKGITITLRGGGKEISFDITRKAREK